MPRGSSRSWLRCSMLGTRWTEAAGARPAKAAEHGGMCVCIEGCELRVLYEDSGGGSCGLTCTMAHAGKRNAHRELGEGYRHGCAGAEFEAWSGACGQQLGLLNVSHAAGLRTSAKDEDKKLERTCGAVFEAEAIASASTAKSGPAPRSTMEAMVAWLRPPNGTGN